MVTITTAQTNTVLHLDKGMSFDICYSDGAYNRKINRCVWTAKEDGSTWAKYCGQWNRVYKRDWYFADSICANGVYDPDSYAK